MGMFHGLKFWAQEALRCLLSSRASAKDWRERYAAQENVDAVLLYLGGAWTFSGGIYSLTFNCLR